MNAKVAMARPSSGRARLSRDFVLEQKRQRVATALAQSVVDTGYHATSVAHIVKEGRVGRKTFYEAFGSKDDCARYLVMQVCPALEADALEFDCDGADLLAVEIAARIRAGDLTRASALIADAEQLLDHKVDVEPLEPAGSEGDPFLATLPPGRSHLERAFVQENQCRRLLSGVALAVHENGYRKATVADITRHAAVSRRTFYEHFDRKASAVGALIDHSRIAVPDSDSDGLAYLWVEILAAAFCGDELGAKERSRRGQTVVRMLAARLDQSEAA